MWWHTHRNQISSFGPNGRVHLNRRGASVQSTTGSRGVRISGSNAGYTMFRDSVKSTGYPLHSPVSLSLPSRASPCAIIFQLESTARTAFVHQQDKAVWYGLWCVVCATNAVEVEAPRTNYWPHSNPPEKHEMNHTEQSIWCNMSQCYRPLPKFSRLQLQCDGTQWRTGGEVKGKLANGVGSQYSSHYLGTWCMQHCYRWCAHLGCQWSTELTPPPI